MKTQGLTVWVEQERLSDGQPVYVALCLELDMASQGATVEEAVENVTDAVMSFFEVASPSEIERRLPNTRTGGVFLTRIEVPVGKTADLFGPHAPRNGDWHTCFDRSPIGPPSQLV